MRLLGGAAAAVGGEADMVGITSVITADVVVAADTAVMDITGITAIIM